MGKDKRLVDLLQGELSKMDDDQKSAFREALKAELPRVIRKAGRAAKKAKINGSKGD